MSMKKHRFKRGETMSEVLVAILLVVLSVGLLATMVGVSGRMLGKADQKDAELYQALKDAETAVAGTELSRENMTVKAEAEGKIPKEVTYQVDYFGAADSVTAYRRAS